MDFYRNYTIVQTQQKTNRSISLITFDQEIEGYPSKAMLKTYTNSPEKAKKEISMMDSVQDVCPNVVKLLFHFSEGNSINLVYQYIEGQSLLYNLYSMQKLNSKISESKLIPLFINIASAFVNLHRAGVQHNYAKLSKILIDQTCYVYIIDFSRGTLGEPEDNLHPTSHDTWALGKIFYELCESRIDLDLGKLSENDMRTCVNLSLNNMERNDYLKEILKRMLEFNPSNKPPLDVFLQQLHDLRNENYDELTHFRPNSTKIVRSIDVIRGNICHKCNQAVYFTVTLNCGHTFHRTCLEVELIEDMTAYRDLWTPRCPCSDCRMKLQVNCLDLIIFDSSKLNFSIQLRALSETPAKCPNCDQYSGANQLGPDLNPENKKCVNCSKKFCWYCGRNNGHRVRKCQDFANFTIASDN